MNSNPITRISIVSYLNAMPFIHGLEQLNAFNKFEITKDIPSVCAQKLINEQTDIGLIPVSMIQRLTNPEIITNYCISANGAVGSVLLVSNEPLEELENLLLDTESRTSVQLAKVLANYYWKKKFIWQEETSDFLNPPKKTGAIIIGDRALMHRSNFKYVYDLADEWKKFTGLPFVFACWVANKKIAIEEVNFLNECFKKGVEERSILALKLNSSSKEIDTLTYFTKYINYIFTTEAKLGMKKFFDYSNSLLLL